jgi:hypothetical protein
MTVKPRHKRYKSETATVTLDGDAVSVSLTNSTVQTNAFEIVRDCVADATLNAKWRFEQINDTAVCISQSVGDKTANQLVIKQEQ